jgi:hypothetical protein
MEEDTEPPRRNDTLLLGGNGATRSSSMRVTEPQRCMDEPPVPPRHLTQSSAPPPYTPRYSTYGFIVMPWEEACRERPFDDQALNLLGFGMDIYYMLGHPWWVQFSNGVSANTHKEFALKIRMTMAHILDEGGVESLI